MQPQRLGACLLVLTLLSLAACNNPGKSKLTDDSAADVTDPPTGPTLPATAAGQGAGAAAVNAQQVRRPVPVFKKPPPEPPEVAVIRQRVIRGDRSMGTLKDLQKLSYKYPNNADVAYILGQLYCAKLWISDCLHHFSRTLALDPSYRENSFLIRSVVAGLGNDGDHFKVRRFLVQQIGQPAQPYLEEVLQGTWRQQVKDRASATLREIK